MTDLNCYGPQNAAKLAALGVDRMLDKKYPPSEQAAPKPRVAPYEPPTSDAPDLELTAPLSAEQKQERTRNTQQETREAKVFWARVKRAQRAGWDGADMICHVANENAAGKGVGGVRKAIGVVPGVPDYVCCVPRRFRGRDYHGLFIEFKRRAGRNGDLGKDQRDWMDRLNGRGYFAVVAFGPDESWDILCAYMGWDE